MDYSTIGEALVATAKLLYALAIVGVIAIIAALGWLILWMTQHISLIIR